MGNEEGCGLPALQIHEIETRVARWFGKIGNRQQIAVPNARFVQIKRRLCAVQQQRGGACGTCISGAGNENNLGRSRRRGKNCCARNRGLEKLSTPHMCHNIIDSG